MTKLKCGVSTPNDIFDSVNDLQSRPDLLSVQGRLLSGFSSETKTTYIVSGDSTRGNVDNQFIPLYQDQLNKIDSILYDNAHAGQSAENWKNNSGAATLQMAIDNTPNTGASTVMEYSYIINDSASTDEEIKGFIVDGITAYLVAKPDALVFIVTSVQTWDQARLKAISIDAANTLGLPVIDGTAAMAEISDVGFNDYYYDATHPNYYGSNRLINYIFDRLLPSPLHSRMNITNSEAIGTLIPTPAVEIGSWVGSTGLPNDGATTWRRSVRVSVDRGSSINIDHGGERIDCSQYDKDDVFISTLNIPSHDYNLDNKCAFIRFNITSDGVTWDALSYTVVVSYINVASPYMNQNKINIGNNIGLPFVTTDNVDDAGIIGTAGQVKTIQSDSSWLWV